LIRSSSIKEFLENLAGSRYESVIYPLLSLKEHHNLFSIEMTLDLYYYSIIAKLRATLNDNEDNRIMAYTIGSEVDMINLLWIYRCKRYFQIPNELIYTFIIPNKHKLTQKNIIELVEAENLDAFLGIVYKTIYKKAFEKSAGAFYEKSYSAYVYEMHKKLIKQNPYSIETVNSYLYFKRIEIKNITSIIEGIRYGLSPDEIKPYIVGFEL
jgi:V/A-type H+-transporting ATPase subunit C